MQDALHLRTLCLTVACLCGPACGGSGRQQSGAQPAPQAQPASGSGAVSPTEEPGNREELAKKEGLELKQFDINRDRRPDIFKFFRLVDDPSNPGSKVEVVVRKELDLNHDGKVDIIRLYDENQQVQEERTDLDFDGRPDEVTFYKGDEVQRREVDLNFDAKPDVIKFYTAGKLVRIESDRNQDGRVDTWEYFEAGALDRVGFDTNGDGEVDAWEKKSAPVADGAAAAAPATAAEAAAPAAGGGAGQ